MDRLTFCDHCSPFIAIKTLNRVAKDHASNNEMIIGTIRENFYVDDYLDSATDKEEMIRKPKDVKTVLNAKQLGNVNDNESFLGIRSQSTELKLTLHLVK